MIVKHFTQFYYVCIGDDAITIIGLDRDHAVREAIKNCQDYPEAPVCVKTWVGKDAEEMFLTPCGELFPDRYDWNTKTDKYGEK